MRKITKRIAAVGIGTVLAIGGGAAWAAWNSTGSGSATASAGTAQGLVVDNETVTGSLVPFGAADLSFTIANPNPYNVLVTDVALSGPITVDSLHSGCNVADAVTFNPAAFSDTLVLAGDTEAIVMTDALSMDNDANDDCQGATFTVPITVTGASSA